jgi:hypothetical protein
MTISGQKGTAATGWLISSNFLCVSMAGLTSFVRGRVGNRRRVSLAPQSPGTQFNQAQPDNSCASHPRTDYESQCQPQQYYDNTRNGEKRNVKKKGADAAYQHYGAKE